MGVGKRSTDRKAYTLHIPAHDGFDIVVIRQIRNNIRIAFF